MAQIPRELQKPHWEAIKKTLPAPYNKDSGVGIMLTGIEAANAAVNWKLLEDAVEDANSAPSAQERARVIAAAKAQMTRIDPFFKALANFRTTIMGFKVTVPAVKEMYNMVTVSRNLEQFLVTYRQQLTLKLENSEKEAAHRAEGLDLRTVLSKPALSEKLKQFMQKSGTIESYDFLVAFEKSPRNKAMYDKYVKKGDLNLASPTFTNLKNFYEPPRGTPQRPDKEATGLWDKAHRDIWSLVENDVFQRFLTSL